MTAVLDATRCPRCERVASPPEPFGCEGCGAPAAELDAVQLAAVGTVRASATVHRHHRPEPATPFTVVEVVIDDGPALKGLLAPGSPPVCAGDRVRGALADGRLVLERSGG